MYYMVIMSLAFSLALRVAGQDGAAEAVDAALWRGVAGDDTMAWHFWHIVASSMLLTMSANITTFPSHPYNSYSHDLRSLKLADTTFFNI